MKFKQYQDHPIAAIFPLMLPAELQEMADDIKKHGLRTDIALYEGKILDGRNRYRACALAGVAPTTYIYAGDDPVGEVLSLNLHRRHLTAGQKAAIAAEALPHFEEEAKKRQGARTDIVEKIPQSDEGKKSRDQAAAQVGVNPRYVSDAKKIKEAAPEVFEKLKTGEVTMAEAKSEALPKPAPLPKPVIDSAELIWAVAKSQLDKITKVDVSREKVLREIISYCNRRIENNL